MWLFSFFTCLWGLRALEELGVRTCLRLKLSALWSITAGGRLLMQTRVFSGAPQNLDVSGGFVRLSKNDCSVWDSSAFCLLTTKDWSKIKLYLSEGVNGSYRRLFLGSANRRKAMSAQMLNSLHDSPKRTKFQRSREHLHVRSLQVWVLWDPASA